MRLYYSLILSFLLIPIFGVGQIYDPVDWSFSKQQISENIYELTFIADIVRVFWHVPDIQIQRKKVCIFSRDY